MGEIAAKVHGPWFIFAKTFKRNWRSFHTFRAEQGFSSGQMMPLDDGVGFVNFPKVLAVFLLFFILLFLLLRRFPPNYPLRSPGTFVDGMG